jgi:hypothetical protein
MLYVFIYSFGIKNGINGNAKTIKTVLLCQSNSSKLKISSLKQSDLHFLRHMNKQGNYPIHKRIL